MDLTNFHQSKNDHGWTLFYPIGNYVTWDDENKWYRSRIEDANGDVVSLGFPKFHNLGEREDDRFSIDNVLSGKNNLEYSQKLDGSLIVRSVHNGIIVIRTRGSFELGLPEECQKEIHKIIDEKMPELKDPNFGVGYSILFEYISPLNNIVIKYTEPGIVLIGGIDHKYLRVYNSYDILERLKSGNVFDLQSWSVNDIVNEKFTDIGWVIELVESLNKNEEGIVVKIGNRLVKIKNSDYLRRHRIKYLLSEKDLAAICVSNGIFDKNDLDKMTKILDCDFETILVIKEKFEQFVERLESQKSKIHVAKQFVDKHANLSKKEIAMLVQKEDADLHPYMFAIANQKMKAIAYTICRRLDIDANLSKKHGDSILKYLGFEGI